MLLVVGEAGLGKTRLAAESVRLRRLVEDLLVIARNERGLPVAAREPLLIQHVVP